MIDRRLKDQLAIVADRFRWLRLWQRLAGCWLAAAFAGGLIWATSASGELPANLVPILGGTSFVMALLVFWRTSRSRPDEHSIAQSVEAKYPDLNARLLAAIEQTRPSPSARFGYLQEQVIRQTLEHSRQHAWADTVPSSRILKAQAGQFVSLAALIAVLVGLGVKQRNQPVQLANAQTLHAADGTAYEVTIEPGDASLERGTGLLVLARFKGPLPKEVTLLHGPSPEAMQQQTLNKSLDDPLFGGRVPVVEADLTYRVEFAGQRTKDYRVTVFDYPDLERMDALLAFPSYTNLKEQTIEDTRRITAVEGTQVTLTFHLNKPVLGGRLISAGSPVLELVGTPEPNIYTTQLTLDKSRRYKLHLLDDAGRENKLPPEISINVVPNRPPELKLVFPGRDLQVSPLEEIALAATAWDDFGLLGYGLSYVIPGQEPQNIVLGKDSGPKEKRDLRHLVALEALKAEPDQLLSYYFWAEDAGPDGQPRRVSGDMYFAEVRHFEEIFRQGQQPSESEQQQQQQQQQSQTGNQAEQMANDLKQIIQATWKLIRRETAAQPTKEFAADVDAIAEALSAIVEKTGELDAKLQDAKSKAFMQTAIEEMQKAQAELAKAKDDNLAAPLTPALASEQLAYQALLKLRAREHEVVRRQQSQRQQQQQSASQQNANRSQQQLNQLELNNQQNRYETERQAAEQKQQDAQRRELSQALNRLRELARRQQDLNDKLKELQNALEQAKTEEQREEIRRQLKRLRDEQQEMLRDVDELLNRMDQPQNQSQMAEASQQLEQTRENVRQASEALQQGQVPQALTSGTRAQRELEQMKDEFRQRTAGDFDQTMQEMRRDARELAQREEDLGKKLDEINQPERKQLRDSGVRQELQEGLNEQKQRLTGLLDQMRKVTQEAETAEPLLSKQLYDTIRRADQQKVDQSLEAARQLVERGFAPEATVVEEKAAEGINEVKQGVERAASSVLGDEAESLRRAREEVDRLAEAVTREIQSRRQREEQNGQPGQPQPGQPNEQQPGQPGQLGEQQPGQQGQPQPGQQGQRGEQPPRQQGQRGEQQPGQQGQPQPGQQGQREPGQQGQPQPGQRGQQPGQQGQPQQGQQGQPQPGQQGSQQPGQEPQQGQRGQQPGQQGQPQQGQRGGQQPVQGQPQQGQPQPGESGEQQPGQPGQRQEGRAGFDRLFQQEGRSGGGGTGPIAGEEYRDWSDRLRDVEEMLDDPQLRAEAARIRDEARSVRAEFKRHSKEPNWPLVDKLIAQPLVELRQRLNEELQKHESREALVPIDRDPVPRQYSDSVRKYYERLGSGK